MKQIQNNVQLINEVVLQLAITRKQNIKHISISKTNIWQLIKSNTMIQFQDGDEPIYTYS